MSRFTGLSGMEPFKSLPGSNSGAAAPDRKRKRHSSSSIESSHFCASGSFAYKKLIEEMLVKERASAETDIASAKTDIASAKTNLDLANSKHKKLTEQLSIFEEILQNDKVKQKDGEKFSSTKYDQFTETLQQLNNQIQLAVKDKMFLENMKSMFLRLGASEETIKTCDNELLKLGNAKNDMETAFKNELNRAARLLEEKDGTVKQLEKDVATNKMALERLTSKIKDLQLEIGVKEEDVLALSISKEKLEGENKYLLSSKNDFADRLELALSEIMNLQDFVTILIVKFMEFEEQSLTFFERHKKLNDLFESCLELAQKEKDVVSEYAQTKLDQIRNQCASVISEKNASQMVNQELNSKVLQLQNEREYAMVQHAEACRLAEEKTRKLESEAECLVSKQTEMQFLIVKLKDSLNKNTQDLLLKYAELENNSKCLVDGLKEEILKKQNEADLFQASAKTDLDLANSKLKKLMEQLSIMEEKLQNAFNENAQLKVKQKEDEKLWRGLESKFSSTKALCDQITETLQQLNIQVQQAEKDKIFFGNKLSATSAELDKLHENMKSMSLRLGASEETIKTRDKELLELGNAKNDMETAFKNELNRAACLLEEKDGTIKQLEKDVATDKMAVESLTSKIEDLQLEIGVKDNNVLELSISKEKLEGENKDLLSSKNDFADRLEIALTEIKNLQDFVTMLIVKFRELEEQSLTFSEKVNELNDSFESCLKLARQEKDLVSEYAQQKLDQIRNQCASVISEKNALQLVNQELNSKFLQLQKEQEYDMVQHVEECRLAEEKTRKLESEAECLVSKQTEMQFLIVKLEDSLNILSENSSISDKNMQCLVDGLKEEILIKQNEADLFQKEFEKSEEKIVALEKRVSELEIAIEEKEQFVVELKTKEKQLDDQKAEALEKEKIASLEKRVSELEIAIEEKEQLVVELKTKECQWDDQKAKVSRMQQEHEDEIKRLQEEFDIQKSGLLRDTISTLKEKNTKFFIDSLNTFSRGELKSLEGIGEKHVDDILKKRPLKNVEDLKEAFKNYPESLLQQKVQTVKGKFLVKYLT